MIKNTPHKKIKYDKPKSEQLNKGHLKIARVNVTSKPKIRNFIKCQYMHLHRKHRIYIFKFIVIKYFDLELNIPVITINVNVLNLPIKNIYNLAYNIKPKVYVLYQTPT